MVENTQEVNTTHKFSIYRCFKSGKTCKTLICNIEAISKEEAFVFFWSSW